MFVSVASLRYVQSQPVEHTSSPPFVALAVYALYECSLIYSEEKHLRVFHSTSDIALEYELRSSS